MVGEIVGGLFDLASSVGNWASQKQAREEQQRENDITREREDNAIQRQANDYANAGFNRLQALGGNGSAASPVTVGDAPKLDTNIGTSTFKNYLESQNNVIQLKQADNQASYYNGLIANGQQQIDETVRHNKAMEDIQALSLGIQGDNSYWSNRLREIESQLAQRDLDIYMRGKGTRKQQENSYSIDSSTDSSGSIQSGSFNGGVGGSVGAGVRGSSLFGGSSNSSPMGFDVGQGASSVGGSSLLPGFGVNAGVSGGTSHSSAESQSMTSTTRNYSVDNQLGPQTIDYYMNLCEASGWKLSSSERTTIERLYQQGYVNRNLFPTLDSYIVYRTLNKYQKQLGIHDASVYGVNISESPATAGRR